MGFMIMTESPGFGSTDSVGQGWIVCTRAVLVRKTTGGKWVLSTFTQCYTTAKYLLTYIGTLVGQNDVKFQ